MRLLLLFAAVTALTTAAFSEVAKVETTANQSTIALTRLSWLIGTWQAKLGNEVVYENWRVENPALFRGFGFTVSGKDTTISEKLLIKAADSGLFYISDVAHNPAPVYFHMISQDSLKTTFENPSHDFPTRIIYRRSAHDSLHARIEGKSKGKDAGVDYFFKRIK